MKSFAALCLLGLVTAIRIQEGDAATGGDAAAGGRPAGAFGPRDSMEKIKSFVDANGDGEITLEEKASALPRAVAAGHITQE